MNAQRRHSPLAALALALMLGPGSRVAADEPQPGQGAAQLQRNIHDIRQILERERAQLDGSQRVNAPLVVDSKDAPGIGRMREQLAQQLEHLESRCFGIDVNVTDGNAVLICGNNNGTTESSNVTTSAHTTVVVPPPASAAATPTPEGEKGEVKP